MKNINRIISVRNPKSPIAEAYRGIRTSIEFSNLDKELKVINVTSSTQNEGKSTVIANLAVSFANLDKKVLIMEGDFSKTDTTEENKVSHIGRELNLFYIDTSNNFINSYTLSVPKLVIKSNDTTIRGGKIKGDIYVESNGLILDDTKVEGNIYFKDKKNKDSFKLENTASVSGNIEIE